MPIEHATTDELRDAAIVGVSFINKVDPRSDGSLTWNGKHHPISSVLVELRTQYPEGNIAFNIVLAMLDSGTIGDEASAWFAMGAVAQAKASEHLRQTQE